MRAPPAQPASPEVLTALVVSLALGAAPGAGFGHDLEDLALVEQLNGALLASRSATLTLEDWCGRHGLAQEPRLIARQILSVRRSASAETLARLAVRDQAELGYRHVELSCGGHVLSEADNWYVKTRLTAEMNAQLETSQTPFGKVVLPLAPTRRTLSVERLWSPLPPDFATSEAPPPPAPPRPHILFRHRAVLTAASGQPIAEVEENYTEEALAFDRRR